MRVAALHRRLDIGGRKTFSDLEVKCGGALANMIEDWVVMVL